jgi:mono/diheme cytochrome c family protein
MKKLVWLTVIGFALVASLASGAEVKALYDKHCAKCHGMDGKGKTKMGRQAGVKDYTDPKVQEEMKDDVALKTIKEGITEKGKERMKPYANELSDADIKALITYMRAFKK